MRILYAAWIRLPTEKAHGAQIMHTCAALARQGAQMTLVIPGRKSNIPEDPFAYYGVEKNFSIKTLRVPDLIFLGRAGFLCSSFLFALRVLWYARKAKSDHIYTRDRSLVAPLSFFTRTKLVWEIHGREPAWLLKRLGNRHLLITISEGLQEMAVALGVSAKHVLVAQDGIDLAPFAHAESKTEARQRLGLPLDANIAMYIGRLDGWKGTDTLLKASVALPDVLTVVVGGEPAQVAVLQTQYPHVRFLGIRPYKEIADNAAAADVLVLPNTARNVTSRYYTSPLKLFAYLAAGKPIVASDLPSIREVVSEQEVYFAPPDDHQALAKKIQESLQDPHAHERVAASRTKVKEYTWDKRAQRIVAFIYS